MANRMKEDEKNERAIRNLLKLPENRRCINCNSLGPQYVCTNFSTFICTPCSGIHREFTHRVKSVSMAKFTSQEVSALQGGGNASAREIYLKEWDSQRNSLPDGSNVQRLRDFIKHVYVERRFTGERNSEKPLRSTMGETDEFHGSRKTDSYRGGSRSPPYEGRGDGSQPGGRSPGYNQEIQRNSDTRSPARSEVVNDWRRGDRFGNERFSDGGSKPGGGSPDSQRSDMSSPPIVRPIRDILGDNVSPIRVIEPPKATGGRSSDIPPQAQRTASFNSLASSSDTNPSEVKAEASFIDFDSVTGPPPATTVVLQEKDVAIASTVRPGVPSDDNWASFDSVKVNTPASNALESSLLDLLAPAPVSASSSSVPTLSFQSSGPPFGNTANVSTGGPWPNVMPQPVTVPISGLASNMPQNPIHGPVGVSVGFGKEPPSDTKSGGRKELPADLFAMNYSYYPPNVQGWYSGSPYGTGSVGFPMQYMPMVVPNMPPVQPVPNMPPVQPMPNMRPLQPVPNMQPVARSTNPFDFGDEPSLDQSSTFPSLTSMYGALPNVTPSLGTNPYHAPLMPGQYQGQQFGGSIPPRPQGQSGFSHEQNAFTSQYPSHQPGPFHTAHSATTSFTPTGGNPFG